MGLSLVKIITTVIYNIYFHPLSVFPGPKSAAATPIPYVYRLINGRFVHWTTYLHSKYGEVVRISPNELSFIGPSAWQDIHASRPQLPRPDVGKLEVSIGAKAMIAADNEDHARQRRIVSHAFSDRAVREQEYILKKYSDLLITRLHQQLTAAKAHTELDICSWLQFALFDIVGDLCFGESFHSLESMETHEWVQTIIKGVKFGMLLTAFQYFAPADSIVRWCIPKSLTAMAQRHYDRTSQKVDWRIDQKSERADFMKYILENNDKKGMTREEINSTVSLLVLAGSGSPAGTCSAAIWYSLKNPSVLQKLEEEIRGRFSKFEDITVSSAIEMPYLHAVLEESLRMHTSEPVALPRQINRPGMQVCGRFVPEGVSVIQRYSGHASADRTLRHA